MQGMKGMDYLHVVISLSWYLILHGHCGQYDLFLSCTVLCSSFKSFFPLYSWEYGKWLLPVSSYIFVTSERAQYHTCNNVAIFKRGAQVCTPWPTQLVHKRNNYSTPQYRVYSTQHIANPSNSETTLINIFSTLSKASTSLLQWCDQN